MNPVAGWLGGSFLGALLPEPQRGALERRLGGDSALASLWLGLVEFLAGVASVYESAMGFLRPMADQLATAYWEEANRRTVGADESVGFTYGGAMLWLFWLLRPTTWLILSCVFVGLLRIAAFLTTRQAVAEPLVWALVRLVTFGRDRAARARERAAFGDAGEADEVEAGENGELFVYTTRRREAWIEAATVEVAERLYRPTLLEPVERAGRRRYRYRFVPAGEHDVIRRYVRYELPKTGIRWAVAGRDRLPEQSGERRRERATGIHQVECELWAPSLQEDDSAIDSTSAGNAFTDRELRLGLGNRVHNTRGPTATGESS